MEINRVTNNAKWIIICKAAQALLQFLIGMLTARYLGPANYGIIHYAKSVVAFAVPFVQLGLGSTLVREFIEAPEKEGEILDTSLLMSGVSSIVSILFVSGFAAVVNSGETETLLVCFLYSLSLLFQIMELVQYWFHYKLQSKFPSMAMLAAYFVVSLYKIILLIAQKSVYWFAVAYSIEYGIVGISLIAIYYRHSGQKLSATVSMAKKLFSRSRYYIMASLMVTLFQNTDHVMLKIMAGDAENGMYTAAITCAGVASFVYAAIVDSVRPVILEHKKAENEEYETSISKLYCVICYLSLLQGVVFALLAKPIVWVLFGPEYAPAIPVLRILVWYLAFSQMGRIRNIWILAEGKQYVLWKINLAGALINVAINGLTIPFWGAAGAAFASLLTQVFANFILGFVIKPLRRNNVLMLKGLAPSFLLGMLRGMKGSKRRS